LVLAILVWFQFYNIVIICVLSLAQGIITSFDTTARQAMMAEIVPDKDDLRPDLSFAQVILLVTIKTMIEIIFKNLNTLYQHNGKKADQQKLVGFADHAECPFVKLGKGQQTIENNQWDKHTQHTIKAPNKGTEKGVGFLLDGLTP